LVSDGNGGGRKRASAGIGSRSVAGGSKGSDATNFEPGNSKASQTPAAGRYSTHDTCTRKLTITKSNGNTS
jgi:hypothetical protein